MFFHARFYLLFIAVVVVVVAVVAVVAAAAAAATAAAIAAGAGCGRVYYAFVFQTARHIHSMNSHSP